MAAKSAGKCNLFVREYLIDRNGTRAAIAAGYAPRSASVTSCRLLRNAKVQAAVTELTEKRLERLEVTADAVLQELAKIAFANMKDCLSVGEDGSIAVDISRITAAQAAALADLRIDECVSEKGRVRRTRLKLASKTRALELLGKHLKLWTDRSQESNGYLDGLAERIREARQRVLRNMSEAELIEKMKELEAEMGIRHPTFNIEFTSPSAQP
jgi:phage terminase small subunit